MPNGGDAMSETPRERYRRERRAVALTRLEELATLAHRGFPDDRPSQENINDMHGFVIACLDEFERHANDAEARLQAVKEGQ